MIIKLIRKFPKGSIWQTRYLCLPFTTVCSTLALSQFGLSYATRAFWFIFGAFLWIFLEYTLHRWVLHWNAKSEAGKEFTARMHVNHHQDTKDESQVCVPILLSFPIWLGILALLIFFGANPQASILVTCGVALMSVIYDIAHYSTHYMSASNGFLKMLKKQHMLHHYSDHHSRFGVTSPFWDYVFRTHK